ncbi:MAG: hypothetical protein D6731_18570 [Planctomycetota bacterium]|nr:MAG: hypothetical protein D6731_18570 [Planctomycetota bacterium]
MREAREEGQALVIVLILIVGLVALLAVMLPTATDLSKAQGEASRAGALNLVLRAGMEDALAEIIDDEDPDGDGYGAVGTGLNGAPNGIPVSVGARTLGVYRATVHDVDPAKNQYALKVVAAWPSLTDPNREVVAAEVLVSSPGVAGWFPDNPFSVLGSAKSKKDSFTYDGSGGNQINSISFIDSSNGVPAVNFSDPGLRNDFITTFVGDPRITIAGLDPNTSSPATGAATVSLNENTAITAQGLAALADAVANEMDAIRTGASSGTYGTVVELDNKKIDGTTETWGGAGVATYLDHNSGGGGKTELTNGATVTGSGLLVIQRDLEIKKGSSFTWDGDVVVYGGNNHSKIKIDDGTFNVTGNIIMIPQNNKRADFSSKDGTINITGSLLSLAVNGETEIRLDPGNNTMTLDGILAMLGKKIDFRTKDTDLTVNGSMVVASAADTNADINHFYFDDHTNSTFNFDTPALSDAKTGLQNFFDGFGTNPPPPVWGDFGYVERVGKAAKDVQAEQDALIANPGPDGKAGLPPLDK